MKIPDQWTFKNADVAKNFDSHVREQLPWYDLVSQAAVHFSKHYIGKNSLIYDIGASTGNFGKLIYDELKSTQSQLIALDDSQDMLEKYTGPGELICTDATEYDYANFDLAYVFLVVMFISPSKRYAFLQKLYNKLKPGGALVIVDKTESPAGYLGSAFRRLPFKWKISTGTPFEDIIKKEMSLIGQQRPITEKILPGFPIKFFQLGEFAGWIIEKPEVT